MYTVVVADDERELRQALIRAIDWEKEGFIVVGEAENGARALELVEQLEPDLLLTDIKMPFLSGVELAKAVREVRPTTQIAFLSGYDDFYYAQQAIQYNIISYMLKPISSIELTRELGQIKLKMDDQFQAFTSHVQDVEQVDLVTFFMPIILDGFNWIEGEKEKEELAKAALSYGLLTEEKSPLNYVVLVTSLKDEQDHICTTRTTVSAIDTILCKYMKHVSFYAQGKVISLLIGNEENLKQYLHIMVQDIMQSIKRIMGLCCLIGVSRPIENVWNLHEAYIEAMNALSYSKGSESSISYIWDVERNEELDQEKVQNAIEDIENLIRGGSEKELLEYLEQLFEWIQKNTVSIAVVKFIMVQFVSALYRIAYAVAGSESVNQLQKFWPLDELMHLESLSDIKEKYISFCLKIKNLIIEQRKKSSSIICEKAIEIIRVKYADPNISLVTVSNEIAVSPNYLSALIKKSTGTTFSDLLTKERIERAKQLLLCSSMKIREVAEKCGYNDQHYFSYCFKKIVGVSPNHCRRQNEEAHT